MKTPDDVKRYFFVDESGDPTFFNRRGQVIVGPSGASAHLLLGYVRTDCPETVRQSLSKLRTELAKDKLFTGIHSFRKTLKCFHAKNDAPEVRSEVFKVLRTLAIKGQFIFARKRIHTFKGTFNSKEGAFYDHLVTHLFKRSLHLARENYIYFAKRGSRARQAPLTAAVTNAANEFYAKHKDAEETTVTVVCQSPVGEPCLQAADYFLWAVQRLFVRGEERFYKAIENQIEFVWDLYDTEKYPENIYTKKNVLTAKKISPL